MGQGIAMRPAHFPGRAPIDAYGNGGFRFAEMSHRGSLLCLPSGIYGWGAQAGAVLTREDFSRVFEEAGAIECLLVGLGTAMEEGALLPDPLRAAFKTAGIALEPMGTGAAVRTYNILLSEQRAVAAALIAVEG